MRPSGRSREADAARNRALPALLLATFPLLSLACGRAPQDTRLPEGTPVVLVSIDTLRADHLPDYGYAALETPAISSLAKDGLLFEHAYSQVPLTLPSHVSILSGLLPADHGIRDNVGYRLDPEAVARGGLPYLPALLRNAGYRTCGAVSAYVLLGNTGVAAGFDSYDDDIEFRSGRGLGEIPRRPGEATLAAAERCLRASSDKPLFLFFHLYEPHSPYAPPEPFASRYPSKYDGAIAAADHVVGELFAELRERALYDRALIVLLSDHGEGLGDHGEASHGVLLNIEAIHVPLIVKLPGARLKGSRIGAPAALIDVAPTILRLLGQSPVARQTGVSLLSLVGRQAPDRRIYSETLFPRLHFGWSDLASLVGARWHLVSGPAPELYDLDSDRGEKRNLFADERRIAAELERQVATYRRELVPPSAVDEETSRAMAALGYLGTQAVARGPLPDPKSKLPALADLQRALQLIASDDLPGAVALLRRVTGENPQLADAWQYLAEALARQGRSAEAIAVYRLAIRAAGETGSFAASFAALLLDAGELDEAQVHARLALPSSPELAHRTLARIALARRNYPEAEREARAAIAAADEPVASRVVLAEVLRQAGRFDEAVAAARDALLDYQKRRTPDPELIRGLSIIEGDALVNLRDPTGAEAAFRREIALFPGDPAAWSHLAMLYGLTERDEQAREVLREMMKANDDAAGWAEGVRSLRLLGHSAEAARLLAQARRRFPQSAELSSLR